MKNQQSVFRDSRSLSRELGPLVQDQLSNVQCTPTSCGSTIEDLRSMICKLSALTYTCSSVLQAISVQGEEKDPYAVLKEIENALTWNNCSSSLH